MIGVGIFDLINSVFLSQSISLVGHSIEILGSEYVMNFKGLPICMQGEMLDTIYSNSFDICGTILVIDFLKNFDILSLNIKLLTELSVELALALAETHAVVREQNNLLILCQIFIFL